MTERNALWGAAAVPEPRYLAALACGCCRWMPADGWPLPHTIDCPQHGEQGLLDLQRRPTMKCQDGGCENRADVTTFTSGSTSLPAVFSVRLCEEHLRPWIAKTERDYAPMVGVAGYLIRAPFRVVASEREGR